MSLISLERILMMNILDIAAEMGLQMKKASGTKGGEWHGPCPCDASSDDRFHVWPAQGDSGTWWCRNCGKGGDAIQFVREHKKMSFPEACRFLGMDNKLNNTGVGAMRRWRPLPTPQPSIPQDAEFIPQQRSHSAHVTDPVLWEAHAAKFMTACHDTLLNSPKALQWLETRRGISRAAAERFMLGLHKGRQGDAAGYLPSYRPYTSWGMCAPAPTQPPSSRGDTGGSASSRVGSKGASHRAAVFALPAGIVIPCMIDGAVRRLRIRRFDPSGPKYHAVSGSASDTFCVESQTGVYVVVETELDAILVDQQAGDIAGAVALGSLEAKPDARAAELLRQASHILIALDFDEDESLGALKTPARRAVEWWLRHFPAAVWWPVPYGKDPCDAWLSGLNIRDWVQAASFDEAPPLVPPSMRHILSLAPLDCPPPSLSPPLDEALPPMSPLIEGGWGEDTPAVRQGILELMKLLQARIIVSQDGGVTLDVPRVMSGNWPAFSRLSDMVYRVGVISDRIWSLPAGVYDRAALAAVFANIKKQECKQLCLEV